MPANCGWVVCLKLKRCVALTALLLAVAAAYGAAAPSARADCDNSNYWNIASQWHSPGEGHSCDEFHTYASECVLSTFGGGYSTIRAFTSTTGGTWTNSALIDYNVTFEFFEADPKVGIQNNHSNTIWVNSLHNDTCT